jgi:large-conductance mechanosensitive channel
MRARFSKIKRQQSLEIKDNQQIKDNRLADKIVNWIIFALVLFVIVSILIYGWHGRYANYYQEVK